MSPPSPGPYSDVDTLRGFYVERDMTLQEVADAFDCSITTIHYWVEKHDLRRERDPWRDPDVLRDLYHDQGLTLEEVASELDCSMKAINTAFRDFEIPRRSPSGRPRVSEQVPSLDEADELRRLYHGQELGAKEIGEKLGVGSSTVLRYLEKHGIERREPWEVHFEGGHEYYYGPNWYEQRRRARKRDGYVCRKCGLSDEDHSEEYGKSLHVHHITKFRKFEDYEEANRITNLLTLCRPCHVQVEHGD